VSRLHTTTAEAVITFMKAIFARHGVPSEVFSDNGPQFSYPQINGLVEKSLQTVKRQLTQAKDTRTDYYQSLLVYRMTPLKCGMSPARLLMGHRLRSNLPIQETKQKSYYDRGTQNLPELHTGDKMRLKDKTNTRTQKATILNEIQPRSFNVQTEDGIVLRRNRHDILGPAKGDQQSDEATEQHQDLENPSSKAAVPVQEQPLKRSSRNIKPPERLTEQI
uniref:Integrase catalytic domain-containing protein n=1 Tax=Periophthalmus magnuspinnatus TaxID=409849 RepID=A0A3B3ZV63_9GOBI